MVEAVHQLGDFAGVALADKAPVMELAPAGLEQMIEPGTQGAGPLEAEVIGESDDDVREEGVEEEEADQGPFKNGVDQNEGHLVGVPVNHGRKLVGCHWDDDQYVLYRLQRERERERL